MAFPRVICSIDAFVLFEKRERNKLGKFFRVSNYIVY